jgi:mono/diheme cytochrome c family protein/DNA-binding beta-propeller fold protein YncE
LNLRAATFMAGAWLAAWPGTASAQQSADAARLFVEHCAQCHGADRLGGTGPALVPESLARLRQADAVAVIGHGRQQTQMPGFADRLGAAGIEALAAYIRSPLAQTPVWGMAEMLRTHVVARPTETLPAKPVHDADPLNLFIVVEAGDSHVTVLDGDRFEPVVRFPSRFALHGGPKFTPDGRFVFFASRDGWITKYDLYALDVVAEIRAGLNTRNLAISADGATVMVGNYLPHTVAVLSAADLAPIKLINAADRTGKTPSRVSAVYQAAPRNSFIVALKDIAELWEISWLTDPPPVFAGMVHNWEQGMVEGLREKGRFPIRRIALSQPLDDFFFDAGYRNVVGSARDGGRAVVVNLDVGREIAEVAMPGLPHLGSGISWIREGRRVMASPNLKEGTVSVIDEKSWALTARIATLGPGFFLRSHENTRYAWVDNAFSRDRDAIQIIDKDSLTVVHTLRPEPGRTASHVEFSRDGRYALLSIAEPDGALLVIDAERLVPIKRLPMRKPSGKYNVFNKISRSDGTSH